MGPPPKFWGGGGGPRTRTSTQSVPISVCTTIFKIKWRRIFAHSVIFTHTKKQLLLTFILNSINWFVFALDKQRVTCEVNS